MEGIRGFAVFLVFFVHYSSLVGPYLPAGSATSAVAASLKTMGNAGVDLFFVLSGFLIYGKLISRPQPFLRFMRRRVERIYPTFIAVFALYLVFSALRPSEDKIPHSFSAGFIYLIQNFLLLPGLFSINPLIVQAWSLSYEMFFYLAIPIVVVVTGMRRWSPRPRIGLFALLAGGFTLYCATDGGHVRLIMFVSGIILYEVVEYRLFRPPPEMVAPVAVAAGLLLLLAPLSGSGGYALKICGLFICFFVFCHTCFASPGSIVARAMSLTPIRWFGNMSYSYYLMHGLALKAFFIGFAVIVPVTVKSPALFWVLFPVVFCLTIIPSALLYLVIERPFSLAPALATPADVFPVPMRQGGAESAAAVMSRRNGRGG